VGRCWCDMATEVDNVANKSRRNDTDRAEWRVTLESFLLESANPISRT